MTTTTTQPLFEPRIAITAISPTLKINEMARRFREDGKTVHHLGFGESQFPPPDRMVAALREAADKVDYYPVQGLDGLKQAVAEARGRETGESVKPEQVLIVPGSKGAIYLAINLIAGDVLLPRPSWVSYAPQAVWSGKQVFWIDTRPENGYVPTADELAAACRQARTGGAHPRILVLNSPNNPTGVTATEAQVRALADAARREKLLVISDEIYARILRPGTAFTSIGLHYPEGSIITSGLSKDVGVGGWRLGWAILPDTDAGKAMMWAFKGLASEIWSSAASPVQHAALAALDDHPEIRAYVTESAHLHAARNLALWQELDRLGIHAPRPTGGFYVYPDFGGFRDRLAEKGIRTAGDLQEYLMREYQIATLPGTAFGDKPENLRLRLSTTHLDCPDEAAGKALFEQWRQAGDKNGFINRHTHPELFAVGEKFSRLITDAV